VSSINDGDFYRAIRDVPDFPSPGIVFRDITPLLLEPRLFEESVLRMAAPLDGRRVDKVLAIESRGFILGAPIALQLQAGLVPARKVGKLPWKTRRMEYALEYGTDAIEVHLDAIDPGDQVLVVDDLIATGGTLEAAVKAVAAAGASLVGVSVLIELANLRGRDRLPKGTTLWTVLRYPRPA
jgi:adenine phosphoribosyltransferase